MRDGAVVAFVLVTVVGWEMIRCVGCASLRTVVVVVVVVFLVWKMSYQFGSLCTGE
jgi:hypothetical protein